MILPFLCKLFLYAPTAERFGCNLFPFTSSGRWEDDAAHSLDATRKHHVQEVHHREWHLELWSGPLGNLHLRQTTLVSAIQQWGEVPHLIFKSMCGCNHTYLYFKLIHCQFLKQYNHKTDFKGTVHLKNENSVIYSFSSHSCIWIKKCCWLILLMHFVVC